MSATSPAVSVRGDSGRLTWLDTTRFGCAIMIVGIHWLRACYNVGLLHNATDSLIIYYQNKEGGLAELPLVLVAGTGHSLSVWLANLVGFVGVFGWSAVSAFILLSGFSLALGGRDPATAADWIAWYRKRIVRLLVPFYICVLPFLATYLILLGLTAHASGTIAAGIHAKLVTVFQTPLLGVIASHTLLFNPFALQLNPTFFAPAWWFIPAILVAYLTYPLVLFGVRSGRPRTTLALGACVTIASYELVNRGVLANEYWYYIALQESFVFTLGVVLGFAWRTDGRGAIERVIFAPWTFAAGLACFLLGEIANWSSATRPVASMLYGPGIVLAMIALARRFEHDRVLSAVKRRVDAYDLYLVHQPFAFPLALALRSLVHDYATFVGWFVYLPVAGLAAMALSWVTKRVFAGADRLRGSGARKAIST